MTSTRPTDQRARPPRHFWVAGLLSLLWNAWAAYIALAAQSGTLPNLRAEQQAYFAAQPLWFVILADIGLLAGIAGAVAMLLQHRSAAWLYAAMLGTIALANVYDLAMLTSPMLSDPGSLGRSAFLFGVMALQVIYARRMQRRGILY